MKAINVAKPRNLRWFDEVGIGNDIVTSGRRC